MSPSTPTTSSGSRFVLPLYGPQPVGSGFANAPSVAQMSRERPIERCPECGSVYKMEYVGPEEDPHAHDHGHGHGFEEPKTFADFVKPTYY